MEVNWHHCWTKSRPFSPEESQLQFFLLLGPEVKSEPAFCSEQLTGSSVTHCFYTTLLQTRQSSEGHIIIFGILKHLVPEKCSDGCSVHSAPLASGVGSFMVVLWFAPHDWVATERERRKKRSKLFVSCLSAMRRTYVLTNTYYFI